MCYMLTFLKNLTFNLWTESYGGHYGPTFFDYFYEQNELITSGQQQGVALKMDKLGIINGKFIPRIATS